MLLSLRSFLFFFFNDTATTEIYTLSLHDALPISHYHELTQLTEELEHIRNFNVAVREVGEEIVFLHRLEPGGADRSYGIHVGRLAGLPAPVVTRAWQGLQPPQARHPLAKQTAPPPPHS